MVRTRFGNDDRCTANHVTRTTNKRVGLKATGCHAEFPPGDRVRGGPGSAKRDAALGAPGMYWYSASGMESGGPPPFSHADRKAFADQLDRLVARWDSP
jgi:hypothetical protein